MRVCGSIGCAVCGGRLGEAKSKGMTQVNRKERGQGDKKDMKECVGEYERKG